MDNQGTRPSELSKKAVVRLLAHLAGDDYELEAMSRYVDKFDAFWPAYGPKATELINHCIDTNTALDDLPDDDLVYRKYYHGMIY